MQISDGMDDSMGMGMRVLETLCGKLSKTVYEVSSIMVSLSLITENFSNSGGFVAEYKVITPPFPDPSGTYIHLYIKDKLKYLHRAQMVMSVHL